MIKSTWIHSNKLLPCQATPCGCESCSTSKIGQLCFNQWHHARSSATKKGLRMFFEFAREKTCLSKKYHMIWYVYFSILVFEPHHKLGYTEGDGCWQDETCEGSHWGAETGGLDSYRSLTNPNSRKTETVQCHQPSYHQQCEVFSPGVGGKVAGRWWRLHQEVTASIFQTWYLNWLKLSVRGSWIWSSSDSVHQCCLRFEFLKCFLVDPSFQSMHIETWFKESKS